ncbi:hypothetical protein [Streptomyces sp. NPDC001404]|uniref:hypothetical protein n=1 Tax=Streptomyces sp. NPDC001404 TaxID=3364571 RepID=UPI0036B98B49
MPRITLPDGCRGLDMADGTKYTKGPGDKVDVSQAHADAIRRGYYGQSGIMRGGEQFTLGTKRGMACTPCKRVWNAWNHECPRCGAPTEEQTA